MGIVNIENSLIDIGENAFRFNRYGLVKDGLFFISIFGNAMVTGCNGICQPNIQIPSAVDGHIVTSIGYEAFYNQNLTSITIPNTVTVIENGAFKKNQLRKRDLSFLSTQIHSE